MANPFSVAALATFPLGPAQTTDNISALPNNQAKGLGAVGTAAVQYYDDLVAPIQLTSGASGVSATGNVTFYLVTGETATISTGAWTNGIDPNATTDQSAKLVGLTPLSPVLAVTANATAYVFPEFSVYNLLGFMPSFWAIVVYNLSGAALAVTSAGNHIAKHSLVNYA